MAPFHNVLTIKKIIGGFDEKCNDFLPILRQLETCYLNPYVPYAILKIRIYNKWKENRFEVKGQGVSVKADSEFGSIW